MRNNTIFFVLMMIFCFVANTDALGQVKKPTTPPKSTTSKPATPKSTTPKATTPKPKPKPEKKETPCKLAFDEMDAFDSLRTIGAEAVSIGLLIPSRFETNSGPKIIDEGQMMFMYSENDSINSFFMTLAIAEYDYQPIENDLNVFIKLKDTEADVISVYNVPDEGTFDKSTNMRIYQHTCVVPMDLFYQLANHEIEKIRINYKKQKRTITLSADQRIAAQKAVQCVGKAAGLWPVKP